ncbi:MAG TPA: metallophosphoesterase [Clostridia bacterium]|nr:metallophosphoesterase [Clostridia bacterium]
MNVGVISDTHGSDYAIRRALNALPHMDAWIHLGDHASDSRALSTANVPVYAVRGNCDFDLSAEVERVIMLQGVRLFLTHGHKYGVKQNVQTVFYRAEEFLCSAVLFGHTHVPLVEAWGSILGINPGSAALPLRGRPSVAKLTIEKGDVSAKIVLL